MQARRYVRTYHTVFKELVEFNACISSVIVASSPTCKLWASSCISDGHSIRRPTSTANYSLRRPNTVHH